ncbi:hypothetical protein A7985_08520 [Pseudoalteromonas luteoviolacea]|uniref:BioF2-like acetyltransferase domain-containing protein n=1 Tax=Pseudoalteromonas luteoviolacea TaxID=43657 RepID=A0A1C0TXB2_9GAMM|nr:GNAT family N-acetyltransferase [Pseudoalteromonas luteoviolacea]OCQ23965.1 hypothetical protein A7985_08520 [Pseudoalteromonas luteoviolacea]
MKHKFTLVPTELDADWDNFVANSPQGSPFVHSDFIAALALPYHAYYCCKGNEKMALVLLITDEQGQSVVGHHDVIHDGIMHRDTQHLNKSQRHSEHFAVQEAIAQYIADKYEAVYLKLHPSITDIRAFLWVNYHNDGPKYNVVPRYTSTIDIAEFADEQLQNEDSISYQNSSVSRRQEIRYGLKKGVSISNSDKFDTFAKFYGLTMARQGIEISNCKLDALSKQVSQLAAQSRLVMFQAQDSEGAIGSFATFLIHNDTAYYFYGANNPTMRDSHTGTAVLWQAFPELAKMGITKLDLEGINSPQRGWFKLSFGGDITPYFHLRLK